MMNRRGFLRGAGVAVALPWLEAAASAGPEPVRMAFLYVPGGVNMDAWTWAGSLAPLQALRDEVLVLGGLVGRRGDAGSNGHDLGCGPWLSTAPIGRKDRGGYCTDVSVDQWMARATGDRTRLPSLELGVERSNERIHTSNISWRAPGSPMGKEVNPRAVFARLFGDPSGDRHRRSVLDLVRGEAQALRARVGSADRGKLDEYLDSLRAVEQRIQFAEREAKKAPPPTLDLPSGVPEDYRTHVRLLLDLVVLAFRTDGTRVVTFMLNNEPGRASWPELGIREHHHDLAHLDPRTPEGAEKLVKLQRIDQAYVELFADFLGKLRAVREGGRTMLDHSMVLYGSGLEWGRKHNRENLPLLLAGRGGGSLRPGRTLRFDGLPVADLHLALLSRMGAPVERIADSRSPLAGLDR